MTSVIVLVGAGSFGQAIARRVGAGSHWHGATPTTGMTHIAITEQLNGKNVERMEKVTDEQYLAGPRKA
jgi:hypothetical protein